MQLQVSLADLVVFDVSDGGGRVEEPDGPARAREDSQLESGTITWGVRFAEEGSNPIVMTNDVNMYDKEVEARMAAAVAKVRSGTRRSLQQRR